MFVTCSGLYFVILLLLVLWVVAIGFRFGDSWIWVWWFVLSGLLCAVGCICLRVGVVVCDCVWVTILVFGDFAGFTDYISFLWVSGMCLLVCVSWFGVLVGFWFLACMLGCLGGFGSVWIWVLGSVVSSVLWLILSMVLRFYVCLCAGFALFWFVCDGFAFGCFVVCGW